MRAFASTLRSPSERWIPWALATLASLLLGCGEAQVPAPRAPPPASAERRGSAFRGPGDPEVAHDVPWEQIHRGVPVPDPRDRIPALKAPRFVAVEEARHVRGTERVLEVTVGEDARAYPVRLLDAHELVNDVVGGVPLLVTWCPLCKSAMAFERTVAGEVRTFGVSGYLYRSAVLMYDHASESFWSQVGARAVAGPLTGTPLVERPVKVTTLAAFQAAHPSGRVLGPEQEGRAPSDYLSDPYGPYHARAGLMFQVDAYDPRLKLKDEVLGVVRPGGAHAWSLAYLRGLPNGARPVDVLGERLWLDVDAASDAVQVLAGDGRPVPSLRCYWFAWYAFHPDTGLTAQAPSPGTAPSPGR
jgi:hypothetical protein